MEDLSACLDKNIGKTLILIDDKGLRWSGRLEQVFTDFFQIYEYRQKCLKVFRFSSIKNFEIKEKLENE